MSKLSRTKGKVWEREVARMLRAFFGGGALIKRGYQTRSGRDGADVEGTPFWVECKHGRNCRPEAALVQAEAASVGDPRTAIAVCKSNRGKPFVALRLDRFLALVSLALDAGPPDTMERLARLRPADLAQLVEIGAMSATAAGTETIVESPPSAGSARGKLTLLAMRTRRPRR